MIRELCLQHESTIALGSTGEENYGGDESSSCEEKKKKSSCYLSLGKRVKYICSES